MHWYWWLLISFFISQFFGVPLWHLFIKLRRGPGWSEPLTPETAELFASWPISAFGAKNQPPDTSTSPSQRPSQ